MQGHATQNRKTQLHTGHSRYLDTDNVTEFLWNVKFVQEGYVVTDTAAMVAIK